LTAGARGGSGSKAGSFRQCKQRCYGPKHAAHQHLLQEQIRLQRGSQGRSTNPAYLLVCLLTELHPDVLCLLNCCACGRHTMTHHFCKYVQRLLCIASGTNGCDSVIVLVCFSNHFEPGRMVLLKFAQVHAARHCMRIDPTSTDHYHSHFLDNGLAIRQQTLHVTPFVTCMLACVPSLAGVLTFSSILRVTSTFSALFY